MGHAGENIRLLRKTMDLSIRQLGEILNIPDGRIESWEREKGTPKVEDTEVLANFFGISREVIHNKKLDRTEAIGILEKKGFINKVAHADKSNVLEEYTPKYETGDHYLMDRVVDLKEQINLLRGLLSEKDKRINDKDVIISAKDKIIVLLESKPTLCNS
jgi:transcriptional regulator with XRE-family HTH domain